MATFEALVIDGLPLASISAVIDRMRPSRKAVDGILRRAETRGLSQPEALSPTLIRVDETVDGKGHNYVAVVTDEVLCDVLHVAENQESCSLEEFYALLS